MDTFTTATAALLGLLLGLTAVNGAGGVDLTPGEVVYVRDYRELETSWTKAVVVGPIGNHIYAVRPDGLKRTWKRNINQIIKTFMTERTTTTVDPGDYFDNVSGIHCFQCNSFLEPECGNVKVNDTGSRFYKECLATDESRGKPLFCRKTVQNIFDTQGAEHSRIIRSCAWVKAPRGECYTMKNEGHEEESCTCYHDACNSSPKVSTLNPFLGLVLIFSMYFFHK